MAVGLNAVLNVAERVVEFRGDGAGFAVFGNHVTIAVFEVVNLAYGADNGGRAARACLFKRGKFFFGNRATLYLQTQIEGDLLQTLIGN